VSTAGPTTRWSLQGQNPSSHEGRHAGRGQRRPEEIIQHLRAQTGRCRPGAVADLRQRNGPGHGVPPRWTWPQVPAP